MTTAATGSSYPRTVIKVVVKDENLETRRVVAVRI